MHRHRSQTPEPSVRYYISSDTDSDTENCHTPKMLRILPSATTRRYRRYADTPAAQLGRAIIEEKQHRDELLKSA